MELVERGADRRGKRLDVPSLVVILLTFVLFVAALVVKGIGHDLLLEAGVFLVSVKLIMMAYRIRGENERLIDELAAVRSTLSRLERALGARQSAEGRDSARRAEVDAPLARDAAERR